MGTFNLGVALNLYPHELRSALRRRVIYDPDFSLQQDQDAYNKMRREPIISHALEIRKHLVAGVDWFMEPASSDPIDRRAAEVQESLFKKVRRFSSALFNLTEAVIRGSSWAKIHSRVQRFRVASDDTNRPWLIVSSLKDIPKQRFRLRPPTKDRPGWRWEVFLPLEKSGRWEEFDPNQYIHHLYQDVEEGLGHGIGLQAGLYTYWWAKTTCLEYGLQYVERWAQGLLIVAVEGLRIGLKDDPNNERMQQYLTLFEEMRARHSIVVNKEDEVKIHDAPRGSWDTTIQALQYFDNGMTRLILGAVLPSGGDLGSGSFARALQESETTNAIVQYDRANLEETIDDTVGAWLWRVNRPNYVAMGLEDAQRPFFRIRTEKHENPLERAQTAATLLNSGAPIRVDELYPQTGFTPPTEHDEVITPPVAQPLIPSPGAPGLEPLLTQLSAALAKNDKRSA